MPKYSALMMIPLVGAAVSAFAFAMSTPGSHHSSLGLKFARAAFPLTGIGGAIASTALLAPSGLAATFAVAAAGFAIGGPAIMGVGVLASYTLGYAIPRQIYKLFGGKTTPKPY